MNKFLKIILTIFISLSISGCSSNRITEAGRVDATTNITWDSSKDSIVVSTVTIKCNDNYYGVVVNDSINFNNDNNYFTTGDGLTISIKEDEEPIGNGTYNYKAKIEDNAYLLVSGNDEDKVKEVFNNVFKTNKESYQMFSHDISSDWTQNVIITSDVVSFSNGTDTTYIYQNDGSLSEGCLDGKIEPTVFKKQLRGIDIPITYPEDIEGVSNYIPYGTQTYDHWTNEGYTPYSAYTVIEDLDGVLYKGNNDKYTTDENPGINLLNDNLNSMTNYIILANNDNNVLNIFKEKNDHAQSLYSLSSSSLSSNEPSIDIKQENLSSVKDIASSVINSENRYHFGVLNNGSYSTQWSESNKDGYYVDNNGYSNSKIAGNMIGKFVAPTIKVSQPTYDKVVFLMKYVERVNYINSPDTIIDYKYALQGSDSPYVRIWGHGAGDTLYKYLNFDITGVDYQSENLLHENHWLNLQYYMLEGDYVYYLDSRDNLYIYENRATVIDLENKDRLLFFDQAFITGVSTYYNKLSTISCFDGGNDILEQVYYVVGEYQY